MTLHVVYDHQCARCKAFYIPYDTAVPCPQCDLLETERFDFIPKALGSLRFNKATTGSYMPGGWYVGSFADHVLLILFGLFYGHEGCVAADFSRFAGEYLKSRHWADQGYLKEHIHGIAVRLYDEMKRYKAQGDTVWHARLEQ
jgi:hypothetical protein